MGLRAGGGGNAAAGADPLAGSFCLDVARVAYSVGWHGELRRSASGKCRPFWAEIDPECRRKGENVLARMCTHCSGFQSFGSRTVLNLPPHLTLSPA